MHLVHIDLKLLLYSHKLTLGGDAEKLYTSELGL